MTGRVFLPTTARRALIGAAAAACLFALTWYLVYHVAVVQRVDGAIFTGFAGLRGRPHVNHLATVIARLCDPSTYVFLCVIPLAMALARGRTLIAAVIVLILFGANETTELLKPFLAAPRQTGLPAWEISGGTWPSGHATASMSLALCCVLAAPPRLRPYVGVLGAGFAMAVTYSFLTLGWHYPSDALGGFEMAAMWTLAGIAAIRTVEARRAARGAASPATGPVPIGSGETLGPPAVAVGALAVLAGLAVLARPAQVIGYVGAHTSFVVGAVALGVLGWALLAGVLVTLSGSGRGPTAARHPRSRRG